MGKLAVATVVAKSFLSLARVLADSFRRYHPETPFFVLLSDEVDGYFDPASEPFQVLRLGDLGIPDLARFRFHYTRQELMYAATPYLLTHLLEQGFSGAAFLKQESLVVGELTPVLELLGRRSIVLTPHLLEPLCGEEGIERELNILQSGVYNVGFLGVSATPTGRAFLTWWRERLFEHCRHEVPRGIHFEQRWLDLVPPGRFFRFSGFDPERPDAVTRYNDRLNMSNVGGAAEIFRRYVRLLDAAGYHETKGWPYAYGQFANGRPIGERGRYLYRRLGRRADRFGDPFATSSPENFFRWSRRRVGMLWTIKRAWWAVRKKWRDGLQLLSGGR